jgi:hypothetical protein
MSYQVTPYVAPIKGLNYNIGGVLAADTDMTECRNVSIDRLLNVSKIAGYTTLGSNLPLTGSVMGFEEFFLTSGVEFLMAFTTTHFYYYDTTTSKWTDITDVLVSTGGLNNLFFSEIMNNILIMTNGKDAPKKWTGTGNIAALGGTPPIAKYVKKFKNYLVFGNTIETGTNYPQRVRWSDTGLPESWTPGAGSNAGYQDLTEGVDFITGLEILGDWLIVFKERSIYAAYLSGTPGQIFAFDIKVDGTGCSAGATISPVKNFLFFMSYDNIYSFDGLNIASIGDNIKDELFSIVNASAMGNSFSLVIESLDEYHLFIPTGSNTTPDTEFIYNYKLNSWTRAEKSSITRTGYYTSLTVTTWASAIGTWAEQTLRWNDRFLFSDAPVNLYGDVNGNVFQQDFSRTDLNGEAQDAYFDTKDFQMGNLERHKIWKRIDIYGSGTNVDVYYSINEGNAWTYVGNAVFSLYGYASVKLDFSVSSDRIRFRFRNPRKESFSIRNYSLYWNLGGRI